ESNVTAAEVASSQTQVVAEPHAADAECHLPDDVPRSGFMLAAVSEREGIEPEARKRRGLHHTNAPGVTCPAEARESVRRAKAGAPDRIRTCGLRLRRPSLYPAELRARVVANG